MRPVVRDLAGLAGFFLLWEGTVRLGLAGLPTATDVTRTCVVLLGQESFLRDVVATVLAWLIAVGVAVAVAVPAGLLLMDEPFASVDAQTRAELEDLLRVRREHGSTVLLVTPDIDESVHLGDRVLVLSRSPGSVVADLTVDLPADRDQITTRGSAAFVALRTEIARLLHDRRA